MRASSAASLRKARKRLAAHSADRLAVESDMEAAGPRVRVATIVLVALFALALGVTLLIGLNGPETVLIVGIALSIMFALAGGILLVMDLRLVKRGTPSSTSVQVRKTLLRAPTGAWYIHDADLMEARTDPHS